MNGGAWFRHDCDAWRDPKIVRLRAKWGWEGYGIFWQVVELMHRQDGKIPLADIPIWASELRIERLQEFVTDACSVGLFVHDDTDLWSERMLREVEAYKHSVAQRSLAGKASAVKRWGNERVTAVKRPCNEKITHNNTEQDKTEEKRREEKSIEEKIERRAYGAYVKLTDTQYTALCQTLTEARVKGLIEQINDWIAAKGKAPYKDYAAAIRQWARHDKATQRPTDRATSRSRRFRRTHDERTRAGCTRGYPARGARAVRYAWARRD
jgi:uncharacterized protein YdaU (DUF1376 family)